MRNAGSAGNATCAEVFQENWVSFHFPTGKCHLSGDTAFIISECNCGWASKRHKIPGLPPCRSHSCTFPRLPCRGGSRNSTWDRLGGGSQLARVGDGIWFRDGLGMHLKLFLLIVYVWGPVKREMLETIGGQSPPRSSASVPGVLHYTYYRHE